MNYQLNKFFYIYISFLYLFNFLISEEIIFIKSDIIKF